MSKAKTYLITDLKIAGQCQHLVISDQKQNSDDFLGTTET